MSLRREETSRPQTPQQQGQKPERARGTSGQKPLETANCRAPRRPAGPYTADPVRRSLQTWRWTSTSFTRSPQMQSWRSASSKRAGPTPRTSPRARAAGLSCPSAQAPRISRVESWTRCASSSSPSPSARATLSWRCLACSHTRPFQRKTVRLGLLKPGARLLALRASPCCAAARQQLPLSS